MENYGRFPWMFIQFNFQISTHNNTNDIYDVFCSLYDNYNIIILEYYDRISIIN